MQKHGEIEKVTGSQDDGVVGVLKKYVSGRVALMGLSSWAKFSRPLRQAQGRLCGTKFENPSSHPRSKMEFRSTSSRSQRFRTISLVGFGKTWFPILALRCESTHSPHTPAPQSRLDMWHRLSRRLATNSETYPLPDQKREIRAPGPTFQTVTIAAFL